jgi:hypothetical protein
MNNITIKTRPEESHDGINYCEVSGARWFNRCTLPANRHLTKGDMFNVYRREYKTDTEGNITEWLCDTKHGCIYDGKSVSSSLAVLDNELNDYYTTYPRSLYNYKPLC